MCNLRSNLQPPKCTLESAPIRTKTPLSSNPSSSSENYPEIPKAYMDRIQWDPIFSLYVELFPNLLKSRLITPIHLPPLEPPFPRWYDSNAHYDFHYGNPGHSIENCTSFKNRVQDLIKTGLIKSKTSNEQKKGGS